MTSRRLSILFAHYGRDWIVGSERCLLDLVRYLDPDRYRSVVVCNSPTLAREAQQLGAAVHCGPEFLPMDRLIPRGSVARLLGQLMRDERIDLAHVNEFQLFKWILPAARRARVPALLHVHLPSTEHERCYGWVHQAACVVGVSHSAVAGFRQDGIPPDRLVVIHNGVDPQRLDDGPTSGLRESLGLEPETKVLTAVGSLIDRKGLDTILEAVAHLRRQGRRDMRLLLVGDGPEEARLRALAATLRVDDLTRFIGRRTDVGAILREASDIVVSAARQEAFPLNVLEAGYCGRPVIASDIAPHREGIVDGVTGFVVPTWDSRAFASSIGSLLDDPALSRTLGDAARERVKREFLIDRQVREFSRLYERLVAQPRFKYGWIGGSVWPPVYTRWVRHAIASRLRWTGRGAAASRPSPHSP